MATNNHDFRSPIVVKYSGAAPISADPDDWDFYAAEPRTTLRIRCTSGSINVHFYNSDPDDTGYEVELTPSLTLDAGENWKKDWGVQRLVPDIRIDSTLGGNYSIWIDRN